jgi:hypothetical protein
MCCGQKRSALKSETTAGTTMAGLPVVRHIAIGISRSPAMAQPSQKLARPHSPPASLRYVDNSPIRVRGPVTGRQYQFSGSSPVQAVEPRDVAGLLATCLFRSA